MKTLTIILIVLGVLLLVGGGIFAYIDLKPHKFQLNLVSNSNGAVCLDGSQTGYYIRKGKGDGKNKFVIFFEGGSWCQGLNQTGVLQSCYNLLGTNLGSSHNWPKTQDFGGILSNSQSQNPDFYNWNQVFIKYCDGSLHQGYMQNPVTFSGKQLYFRGQINTKEVLDDLQGKYNLNSASNVIIAGFDSGATAVYLWADYIYTKYLTSSAKVYGLADSGYYIDYFNYKTMKYDTKTQLQQLIALVDQETKVPNQACSDGQITTNQYKCLFPQYITKFITTPIFVMQSLYDIWIFNNNCGIDCLSETTSNLDQCSQVMDYVNTYKNLINTVISANFGSNQGGVWQLACAYHNIGMSTSTYYMSSNWQAPVAGSKYTAQQAFSKFISGGVSKLVDPESWPDNANCARVNF